MTQDKNDLEIKNSINEIKGVDDTGDDKSFEVKTMPQKFLSVLSSSGGRDKRNRLGGTKKILAIGGIVIVAVGALMFLAAWLFLKSMDGDGGQSDTVDLPVEKGNIEDVAEVTGDEDSGGEKTSSQEQIEDEDSADEFNLTELLDVTKWSSYDDSELGYKFKYPTSWVSGEFKGPTDSLTDLAGGVSFSDQLLGANLFVEVFVNSDKLSLDQWLETNKTVQASQYRTIKIDNIGARRYDGDDKFDVVVAANSYVYSINFDMSSSDYDLTPLYNEFLINFNLVVIDVPNGDQQPLLEPGLDSDGDGLTDMEEDMYRTDKLVLDSDGDGYQDGDEVVNLYNPLVAGSARIYDSNLVKEYVDSQLEYRIFYPSSWEQKSNKDSVIFQSDSGEFFQILFYEHKINYREIETTKQWYKQFIDSDLSGFEDIKIAGLDGLLANDGMSAYVLFGGRVYQMVYNIGLEYEVNFKSSFNMMVKSFTLLD